MAGTVWWKALHHPSCQIQAVGNPAQTFGGIGGYDNFFLISAKKCSKGLNLPTQTLRPNSGSFTMASYGKEANCLK